MSDPIYEAQAYEIAKMARSISTLEAENAKLRELVMGYHKAMVCCLQTGMWPTDPKWLEKRMRELGVVPDDAD